MADKSLGELFDSARTELSSIASDTIELGKQEIGSSAKNAGIGAGLVGAALAVAFITPLIFAFSLAEALASLGLWRWVAFLITAVFILLVAAGIGLIAWTRFRKVKAPTRTVAAVKGGLTALAGLLPTAQDEQVDPFETRPGEAYPGSRTL